MNPSQPLLLITAYLLGAIPFGYLLVLWTKGVDVRKQGSGNIGMTNVWRAAGPFWGILTLLLDAAKGALAVAICRHFDPGNSWLEVGSALCALFGNVFSVFLNFKGGKGIGISIGIFFSLLPFESAIGTLAFIAVLLIFRMISVGSLTGVTIMAILSLYRGGFTVYSGLALLGCVMVWWTHRQNIRRILNGTERRIGLGKKSKGENH